MSFRMTKIIQGTCFNVSMFRSYEGVDLLSLQLRTDDATIWKFNMGRAFDDVVTEYKDLYHVMNAKIHISTADDSQRMILHKVHIIILYYSWHLCQRFMGEACPQKTFGCYNYRGSNCCKDSPFVRR